MKYMHNEKVASIIIFQWFADYMNETFYQYMRSIYDENMQWLSIATINSSFYNWVSRHMQYEEGGDYEKYNREHITIFGGPFGRAMSCEQLIVLLMDYHPTLHILDIAVNNDKEADVHEHISLWSVFVPARFSQWKHTPGELGLSLMSSKI